MPEAIGLPPDTRGGGEEGEVKEMGYGEEDLRRRRRRKKRKEKEITCLTLFLGLLS